MLDAKNLQVLNEIAIKLGIPDPSWLYDLIAFETGGTFSPTASNPKSSAKGLIQFIDSTARDLGYSSSADLIAKHPTFESQIRVPVYNYLRRYMPFNNEYQLYMSVFYPAARRYSADTTFKQIFTDRFTDPNTADRHYKSFINANPGIFSPQHYVDYVKKRYSTAKKKTLTFTEPGMPTVLMMLGLAGLAYYYLLHSKF